MDQGDGPVGQGAGGQAGQTDLIPRTYTAEGENLLLHVIV